MSINTLRKIRKNLQLIHLVKPAKTSPYRPTAEAIIQQYASREIPNFKTALNLVLKLSSKRPELTQKKFNTYIEANKPAIREQSKLDFGLDTDDDFKPMIKKPKITIRSTPKRNQLLKSLYQQSFIIGLLELISKLLQHMRRQKKQTNKKSAYTLLLGSS